MRQLILSAADGLKISWGFFNLELKKRPDEAYEILASVLFATENDNLGYLSETQSKQLCKYMFNDPDFNWDHILREGETFLYKTTKMADKKIPALREVVGKLLKKPYWRWNHCSAQTNCITLFSWIMLGIYNKIKEYDSQLEFLVDQTIHDWNSSITTAGNVEYETPLLWYVLAGCEGVTSVLKTLPKMAIRTDLNWLYIIKRASFQNGTSPISNLFKMAIKFEEAKKSLDIVLNRLFETVPNFSTYLDDMLSHPNCSDIAPIAKVLIQKNRECFNLKTNSIFLEDFYARIQHTRKQPISERLSKQISIYTRNAQLDFILRSDNKEIHQRLRELKPGECYRIPKNSWNLQRCMNVLRTPEGEYQLILETKSKLPDHTPREPKKTQIYKKSGSYKEGKPAWRIDGVEIKYFHLVYKFEDLLEHEAFKKEILLSQKLGKKTKHIVTYYEGLSRNKGDTQQSCAYALGASGTVNEMHKYINSLDKLNKYRLIQGLLLACLVFHHNDYCHQDITSSNVLVMSKKDGGAYLALTDFGTARKVGTKQSGPRTTFEFAAPEIFDLTGDKAKTLPCKYEYYHENKFKSLGKDLWADQRGVEQFNCNTVDFEADIWSIGIVVYQILHNKRPTLDDLDKINDDPLLAGLLAIKPSQRVNIRQAMQLCNKIINELTEANKIISEVPPTLTIQYEERQRLLPSQNGQELSNEKNIDCTDCFINPIRSLMRKMCL